MQVSTLINVVEGEAKNIFSSFTLGQDEHRDSMIVMEKSDAYFIPKCNVIHERACLYQHVQHAGEHMGMFIHTLYELSEQCEFTANHEEHIKIHIMVGIQDSKLSH